MNRLGYNLFSMIATNPFPGMNPYLEQRWGDVHASMVTYMRDLLQDALPDDLRARMHERVFIESADNAARRIHPNVHVYERLGDRSGSAAPVTGAAVTESYVELISGASGGRVVTVIEFLTPLNKSPGPGRDLYLQKQIHTCRGHANLVEVDLLRAGHPTTLTPPPPGEHGAYHVSVFRVSRPDVREYYAIPLRNPLPIIPIPLRADDRDVTIDLQALLELCYRRGGYDDIDYQQPPEPRLSAEDTEWVEQLLKAKRLR